MPGEHSMLHAAARSQVCRRAAVRQPLSFPACCQRIAWGSLAHASPALQTCSTVDLRMTGAGEEMDSATKMWVAPAPKLASQSR